MSTSGIISVDNKPICNEYVTLSMTLVGYILFIISEMLGMRDDKTNKCTSVIQLVVASSLFVKRRISRLCKPELPTTISIDDDRITLHDIEEDASRYATLKLHKRSHQPPVVPDPAQELVDNRWV